MAASLFRGQALISVVMKVSVKIFQHRGYKKFLWVILRALWVSVVYN